MATKSVLRVYFTLLLIVLPQSPSFEANAAESKIIANGGGSFKKKGVHPTDRNLDTDAHRKLICKTLLTGAAVMVQVYFAGGTTIIAQAIILGGNTLVQTKINEPLCETIVALIRQKVGKNSSKVPKISMKDIQEAENKPQPTPGRKPSGKCEEKGATKIYVDNKHRTFNCECKLIKGMFARRASLQWACLISKTHGR